MIDTTNRNTALASALVDELARCGVRQAFLSPGSRSSPIALALDREPSIDLTVILDERVSGFAALGAALATGSPTIVACTSGSAAANLHPAVVEADQAGVPIIVLTSDRPPELRGIGAGQTIDQIDLYGNEARWFSEVGTHEADDTGLLHLRSVACRAFGEAMSGRGPVHLNLAWRDPLGPEPSPGDLSASDPLALEGRSDGRPLTVAIEAREPGGDLLDVLAQAAERAERGVIVAGRLTDDRITAALAELSEMCGFPILAEPTSQLRFGTHDRTGVIASYDLISRSQPEGLAPDFVLRFGDMPTSKPLRVWLAESGVDQIVVDPPGRWNEPTRLAGAFVRADAGSVITGICSRVAQGDLRWRQRWVEAEESAQGAIDETLGAGGKGLSEPLIQRLLGDAYGTGERVLLGSSMPIRDAEAFLRGGDAQATFHANRGANGIDGLIASGSGIALATGEPTWIVLGDLALAHDLGGLAATAAFDSPLRIVVIDNGGGGIFDFLPQAGQVEAARFSKLFTTPTALDVERAAGAFDVPYLRVETAQELLAVAEHDRVLAHVPVDRSGNVELHRLIAEAVEAALRS
jgi:2-succinyl-5-enolpyruvyl-6-hydroxy-3-cyclohexene-1-carboxylate synthase